MHSQTLTDDPGTGHTKQMEPREGAVPVTTYRRSCMPMQAELDIAKINSSATAKVPDCSYQRVPRVLPEVFSHLASESVSLLHARWLSVVIYCDMQGRVLR